MLKNLMGLAIFVFIIVAALAPYVSAKKAEEKVELIKDFEQTLSLQASENLFIAHSVVPELSYPLVTSLRLISDILIER